MDEQNEVELSEVEKLALIAKTFNVTNEIFEILIKNKITVLEVKELMEGYVTAFNEAIQKHPDKMNEPIRKGLFKV